MSFEEPTKTDKITVIPRPRPADPVIKSPTPQPTTVEKGDAPPWKNTLEQYTSFNTIFTLYALTPDEINKASYIRDGTEPKNAILRSGGGLGDKKTITAFETSGRVEYYIDNVEVESIIAPNDISGIGSSITVKFTVTEPYSIGMFLQSVLIAAKQAGYGANYTGAPYLLKMEFIGWDEDNRNNLAPKSTRLLPFIITNITFEATEAGTQYAVDGFAWTGLSFLKEHQTIKTDVSLSGSTVLEILQTGSFNGEDNTLSLAQILNKKSETDENSNKSSDTGRKIISDRYVFLTPNKFFKNENSTEVENNSATKNTQAQPIKTQANIPGGNSPSNTTNSLNVHTSSIISEFELEARTNVSEIGNSAVGDGSIENKDANSIKHAFPNSVYDESFGGISRVQGLLTIDKSNTYNFKAGSKIEHIIEQIVLLSDYVYNAVEVIKNSPPDGLIPWFKVECEVYINSDQATLEATGRHPYVFVWKVVPYTVSVSIFKAPNKATSGIGKLSQKVSKEYNYIYTGQNKDILDFKLEFNTAYYNAISSNLNIKSTAISSDNKNTSDKENVARNAEGKGQSNEESPTNIGVSKLSTQGPVPSPEDNINLRIARSVHDAIINSNTDLITLDLTIKGDPFYIPTSNVGNYNVDRSESYPDLINEDGSINYQNGFVYVRVNFKTPIDYNQEGLMDFVKFDDTNTKTVSNFSGIYRVMTINHSVQQNNFIQVLRLLRLNNQDVDVTENTSPVVTTTDPNADQTKRSPTIPDGAEAVAS